MAIAGAADDLLYAGAAEQARRIRAGEVSASELVTAALARIADVDPPLNAYRAVFAERALAEANAADARAREGTSLPLLGVPVAIKDDIDVAGEITAWGTDAFGAPKSTDADVVARLRAAGAVIIGKTNVPEMTLWPWTSSQTWGVTSNPWDTERTPGGSSGGAAVAVATGTCGVAIGSDGGGSIRYPAALTGVFGLKPQRDRISLGPDHHDAWNGLLGYGPLTRTVRDAAVVLDAVATGVPPGGFAGALDTAPGRLRIAVSLDAPPGSGARLGDEQRGAVEETVAALRALGHDVFGREIDYGLRALWSSTVRYLSCAYQDVASTVRPERLEANTRRLAAVGRLVPRGVLERARRSEHAVASRMNRVFDHADLVITPAAGGDAPKLSDVTDRGLVRSFVISNAMAWTSPWNVIGQPAASVPAGWSAHGLPLAVQLCARWGDEVTLLRVAAQLEQARPWVQHRPPDARSIHSPH